MFSKNISRLITALMIMTLSGSAYAKRRETPSDDKVMIKVGEYNQSNKRGLNPNDIKVFVWNMYKGRMESWKTDYEELVPEYDILLLQEFWFDGVMKSVFENDQKFTYQLATAFIDTKENNAASGVGIASAIQPNNLYYQRSKYTEPFIVTHKMVLFAQFDLEGRAEKLLTGTIHAINFVSAKKLRHQLQTAAAYIKTHQGPVVFGGDFNTWSDKKLEHLAEFARDAGLTEVKFPNGDERMKVKGKDIDYIFVRGVIENESYVYGEREGADHKALSLHFSVK